MSMTSYMTPFTPSNFHQALMQRLGTVGEWADQGLYGARAAAASRLNQQQQPSMQLQNNGASQNSYMPSAGQKGDTFENFIHAIAGRESGGNYRAVNPDSGALGKYQIMPGNVPAWSMQILGHRVSPSQFLASPQLQEQIAQGMLRNYYNKWGPGGAAVAWYAGPGTAAKWVTNRNRGYYNSPQGRYSSINAYALGILRAMGLR